MSIDGAILNVVLAGVALAAVMWGLRQRALLERVRRGIELLLQGKSDVRARRGNEDTESVLTAFDRLAVNWDSQQRGTIDPAGHGVDETADITEAVRRPLAVIHGSLALLAHHEGALTATERQERIRLVRARTESLLRLLESPPGLSELHRQLSNFHRQSDDDDLDERHLLLVDDEGSWTDSISSIASGLEWSASVAPGVEACDVMQRHLSPNLLLVNGGHSRGLGWRALARIRERCGDGNLPTWLYAIDAESAAGRVWSFNAIWFWPDSIEDWSPPNGWRPPEEGFTFAVGGVEPLRGKLFRFFTNQGGIAEGDLPVEMGDTSGMGTAVVRETKAPHYRVRTLGVVPAASIENDAEEFSETFRESLGEPTELTSLIDQVILRLSDDSARHEDTTVTRQSALP
ncbi:hypothetical protein Pan216_27300 [Planctomycetes bacterium Pan216]|uniref:histidine kinase n=1 Tax=Kolteria novifilia TaxID=2527975 RepID=A0A518B4F8_9BACT|nr:hypothetical protein Pan216_27300 [Planctomycetes bacterium Pan216]